MRFFDCNCYFGLPSKLVPSPALCPTADDLVAQLERAGIERAIVWHIAQQDVSPQRGNEMLAEAIGGRPNLLGCWTLLPPQTGEMPVSELLAGMKAARIVALRAFPGPHRFMLNRLTLGVLLDEMVERRIPLLCSMKRMGWPELYGLLAEAPGLTAIITDHGSWGSDRYFRPLLDNYGRVYVDTTLYFLDGGVEDLVSRYGPGRMVFGSGLPERYPGGMMMAIRHGEIDEDAKAAIASGNLNRLVEEVKL
jgi:predicted TIM-barrel fold metal-dependent hydrolase